MRHESFERFYLTKIALGECCGCAEHATRMRDLDAYANRRERLRGVSPVGALVAWLIRLLRRRSGLTTAELSPDL